MTILFNNSGDFGYDGCTDEDMNLLALRMDADNGYSFDSQSLSPSCPSTSGSFSSAPSLCDPFTPTSRTSTPQQHLNFSGSFSGSFDGSFNDDPFNDDSIMLDLTPPPSATLAYFPQDLKTTVAPNMLMHHGMPSTPSRCGTSFDNSLASHIDYTPTPGDMALYNFPDQLGPSPFLDMQSSIPQFDNNTPSFDLASVWPQNPESSPIDFSSPAMQFYSSPFSSPYAHDRRRVAMDRPQSRSTMLQQQTVPMTMISDEDLTKEEDAAQHQALAQNSYDHVPQTPTKSRPSKARSGTRRSSARNQPSHRVSKPAQKVKIECDFKESKHARQHCHLDGCGKSFMRLEHLKRHQVSSSHVAPGPESWIRCPFCTKCKKKFDPARRDNFKDHIKRHVTDSPGSRTDWHPDASAFLAKLESESKPKSKTKKVPESARIAAVRGVKTAKADPVKTEAVW